MVRTTGTVKKAPKVIVEEVLVARGLTRVFAKDTERASQQREAKASVMSCEEQRRGKQRSVHVQVMVVNFGYEETELPKGTILGVAGDFR